MAGTKVYVTNNHTEFMEIPIEGGGLKRIEEGKTEQFVIANPDSAQIQAWKHVGLITISDKAPKGDDAASASASTGSPDGSLSGPGAPPATDAKAAEVKK